MSFIATDRGTPARSPSCEDSGGTAICYVPTRNRADGVAGWLLRKGIVAAPYHADLPAADRRRLLAGFLDGSIRVMAATNAFGMGIDKPDVRLVLHLGIPARPESYYQEAGRAGRDGEPARCQMLWTKKDLVLMRRLAGRGPAAQQGLRTMRAYAHRRRCRRYVLLEYLGERLARCSGCDVCAPRPWSVATVVARRRRVAEARPG